MAWIYRLAFLLASFECALSWRAFEDSNSTQKICDYFEADFNEEESGYAEQLGGRTRLHFESADVEKAFADGHSSQVVTKFMLDGLAPAVGLVLAVLMWPFLWCCCCSPDTHPACECCRKAPDEAYETCELKWPAVMLMLACLLIIGGGVIALKGSPQLLDEELHNSMCKMLKFQHKTIYGFHSEHNVTYSVALNSTSSFFIGYHGIKDVFHMFPYWGNFSNIILPIASILNSSNDIWYFQQQLVQNLRYSYDNYSNIDYTDAFYDANDLSASLAVPSTMRELIGPYGQPGTVLGDLSQELSKIFDRISSATRIIMEVYSYFFSPQIDQWRVDEIFSHLNSTLTSTILPQFQRGSERSQRNYERISPYVEQFGRYVSPLLYVFIGVAGVGLISALSIVLCRAPSCRNIVYVSCGVVTILSIAALVVATVLAISDTVVQHSCTYFLADFTAGLTLLHYPYNREYSAAARRYLDDCTANTKGNALKNSGTMFHMPASDLWQHWVKIEKVAYDDELISYNSVASLYNLVSSYREKLNDIRRGKVLDIGDSMAITYLKKLANHQLPMIGCNAAALEDAFVPSLWNSQVRCPQGANERPPCSDLSSPAICPFGCYGIYDEFTDTSGDSSFMNTLYTRYGGSSCSYYSYIADLHANWNLPRVNEVNSIEGNISWALDGTPGMDYLNRVQQLSSNAASARTYLDPYLVYPVERDWQMGVDCRLLQEPIMELRNALCTRTYPIVHSLALGTLLMGWGGVLFMMTAVCTGVRQFKNERMRVRNAVVGLEQPSDYKFVEREPNRSKLHFVEQSHEDLFQRSRR